MKASKQFELIATILLAKEHTPRRRLRAGEVFIRTLSRVSCLEQPEISSSAESAPHGDRPFGNRVPVGAIGDCSYHVELFKRTPEGVPAVAHDDERASLELLGIGARIGSP